MAAAAKGELRLLKGTSAEQANTRCMLIKNAEIKLSAAEVAAL